MNVGDGSYCCSDLECQCGRSFSVNISSSRPAKSVNRVSNHPSYPVPASIFLRWRDCDNKMI